MNPDLLLDNLAAIAAGPGGVDRLRELILKLGVQGKLGTQDTKDEPASVLFERIKGERKQVGKGGNIRPEKPFQQLTPESVSFPNNWQLCCLGEISEIIMGNSPPGDTYNKRGDGVPLINGPTEFSKEPFGKTLVSQYTTQPTKFCRENDLLICVRGATTGRTNIAGFDACIGRGVAVIRAPTIQSYLNLVILTKAQQILAMGTGSTFPSISQNDLLTIPFPLPPLAEQDRIVQKVDRLMALCDDLEARQKAEREERRRLRTASLTALEEAATAEEAERAWAHVAGEFGRLVDSLDDMAEVRKLILQLAVQGRFVRQEPEEKPVKIAESKRPTRKSKSQNGDSTKTQIIDIFSQDSIPENWRKTTLNSVGVWSTGGTPSRQVSKYFDGGIPWIKSGDLNDGIVTITDETISQSGLENSNAKLLPKGTISIALYGATIGKLGILGIEATTNQACANCVIDEKIITSRYLFYFLQSQKRYLIQVGQGGAQPNITNWIIWEWPIIIPPLAEQHRIIENVDHVMALCDTLEAGIRARDAALEAFAGAACRAVLDGPAPSTAPAAVRAIGQQRLPV